MTSSSDSLMASLRDAIKRHSTPSGQSWRIEEDSASPWIWVSCDDAAVPEQGWKLHLSATVASAVTVLERAVPILLANGATFKTARSLTALQSLNEGRSGFSQVGKFVTVYPADDAHAVHLATVLDEHLQFIPHPDIPSDRPLAPGSVVHYRYGSFGHQEVRVLMGQVLPALQRPNGDLVPDRRTVPYHQPDWVQDPFLAAGAASPLPARPRLLAERYLIVHTVDDSARGSIHLGADIATGRRCLLKMAARDAQVDETGRGASHRLRHEAELLRRFSTTLPVPEVVDVVERNQEVFLVMQDVEGETLSEFVHRLAANGRLLSTAEVIEFGKQLTSVLSAIHEQGVVHRDVKSDNVVIGMDRRLWLMDFEIACDLNGPMYFDGRGTEGYMSPQAAAGEAPMVLDDIYSLGAVLYFVATAAEPSWAPTDVKLTHRPIHVLNAQISSKLSSLIDRCLAPDVESRFQTMAAVADALEHVADFVDIAVPDDDPPSGIGTELAARDRALALARRLGDSLCTAASRTESGVFWASAHDEEGRPERRDLAGGTAGVLLALSELVAEFDNVDHRNALIEGAEWLRRSQPSGRVPPGLYVGESGVAAALLRAGQVLDRADLVEDAANVARAVARIPHVSPDMFHGSAGRLRTDSVPVAADKGCGASRSRSRRWRVPARTGRTPRERATTVGHSSRLRRLERRCLSWICPRRSGNRRRIAGFVSDER